MTENYSLSKITVHLSDFVQEGMWPKFFKSLVVYNIRRFKLSRLSGRWWQTVLCSKFMSERTVFVTLADLDVFAGKVCLLLP